MSHNGPLNGAGGGGGGGACCFTFAYRTLALALARVVAIGVVADTAHVAANWSSSSAAICHSTRASWLPHLVAQTRRIQLFPCPDCLVVRWCECQCQFRVRVLHLKIGRPVRSGLLSFLLFKLQIFLMRPADSYSKDV